MHIRPGNGLDPLNQIIFIFNTYNYGKALKKKDQISYSLPGIQLLPGSFTGAAFLL